MNKLANQLTGHLNASVSDNSRTMLTKVAEFSLFGGIIAALVVGVIRLQ